MENVLVVVLSYGPNDVHDDAVRSVLHAGVPEASVIVVRNPGHRQSSFGVSAFALESVDPEVNLGYAAGMNRGIARALSRGTDDYLLLLTQDVELREGSLRHLLSSLEQRPSVAVVGPRLIDRSSGRLFSSGIVDARGGLPRHVLNKADMGISDVSAVDGSCMLVRPEALRECGDLDERFFMYFEETELCLRLRNRGWRVTVANSAEALSSPGGGERQAAHAYLRARNGLEYARLAAGRAGVARFTASLARETTAAWPKPFGQRFGQIRWWSTAFHRTRGTVAGAIDFALGRWGPPPERFQRNTDISGT